MKTNLSKKKLGIVTPIGNEGENLKDFIRQVLNNAEKYFLKITYFLVTDKATSLLAKKIIENFKKKDKRIELVHSPKNKNVVDAYLAGYKKAILHSDYILEIDAGFSHDPSQIKNFLKAIEKNRDCLLGIRFGHEKANFQANFKRTILSYGGTQLINLILGTTIPDMTSGYSLYTKECLTYILQQGIYSKSPFFQSEMRYQVRNHRYLLIPITYKSTSSGGGIAFVYDSFKNLFRLFLKQNFFSNRKK